MAPKTRKTNKTTDEMSEQSSTMPENVSTTQLNSTSTADATPNPDAQLMASILELVKSGILVLPSTSNELNKSYKTPTFIVPVFADKTKLVGHRNYKL